MCNLLKWHKYTQTITEPLQRHFTHSPTLSIGPGKENKIAWLYESGFCGLSHATHKYTPFIISQCVSIHMVVKRVNITIEDDLHIQASDYADAQGMAFSVLVSKALRSFMEGGPAPSPSPSPAITHQNLMDFLNSDEGRDAIKSIAREVVPAQVAPAPVTPVAPVDVPSPVKAKGSVKSGPAAL